MTEHSEEEIGDDDFPIFTTNLNHLIDRGYPRGYADGLNAAREAVEAIPAPYKVIGQHETYDSYHEGRSDMKDAATSAIEALKEES